MKIINPYTVVGSFALLLAGLAYLKTGLGQKVTGIGIWENYENTR